MKKYMTPTEATEAGYSALTTPYTLQERWMLDAVLADMKSGHTDAVEVRYLVGTEVWRKNLIIAHPQETNKTAKQA
jgi:hypothetical protein